jgi:adenylylsulfate kinase-like enzyme
MIYWFTGQPGAGKTTLALALQQVFKKCGKTTVHFDGEFVRELLHNADYSPTGRAHNMTTAQTLARKLASEGVTVLVSMVSPYRAIRERLKEAFRVVEIYVHASTPRGRESYFVKDFEVPLKSFLDLDTTNTSVDTCVARILAYVDEMAK